ncbi:MAG: manganese efflux pump [Clostridia bacterium]|nr:manganese efflux pump [Clostridia bacterium]
MFDFLFFFNSILIGIGLAMDAFSVSLANGLNEPRMPRRKVLLVAGVFAVFQAIMPLIGWFFVHSMVEMFGVLEKFIPWIALALLGFIGGKMLIEGIKEQKCLSDPERTECPAPKALGLGALLVQGVATSIDALSVGFTISEYIFIEALVSVLLIGAVTFGICFAGILLGKKFGTALAGKSSIFGGAILIFIGLEIFVTSFF